MNEIGTIDVLTEADAWTLLENAILDRIPTETDVFKINIGHWPVLHLKVDGNRFSSSMNAKMMSAFLDLQNNIYRTYAKLQYDLPNGRLLTNEDKSYLELMVGVKPGSSLLNVNFEDICKKLIEGAIPKMDGKHFVVLGVSAMLLWTSHAVINGYIASQTEQKKIEASVSLSKEETRRLEIMKEATSVAPYVGINKMMSEEVINKILKGSLHADSITIGGHTFDRKQVEQLIRSERSISNEVRLDGEYRILKVDSSSASSFKVELQDTKTFRSFGAVLQDSTVTKERNKELLQEAEWNRQPINLAINAREVKGDITSAVILDVKDRYTKK
jgi:hypothetical protein